MTGPASPGPARPGIPSPASPAPTSGGRRAFLLVAAALFALAGLSGVLQLVATLFGYGDQPGVLLALHALAGPLALVSATGIVRGRVWTSRAVLLWTVVMLAIFAAIGPSVGLAPAVARALWAPAAVVVVFAALVLWALRAPAT